MVKYILNRRWGSELYRVFEVERKVRIGFVGVGVGVYLLCFLISRRVE